MAATTTGAAISPWSVLTPRTRSAFDQKLERLRLRLIGHSEVSGAGQEIVGHSGSVAVAGIGFVGGQFDFIDRPVRLQLFEFDRDRSASH